MPKTNTFYKISLILASIVIITPFVFYISTFSGNISDQSIEWANLGSFYGGITSSIFSFFTLIFLIINIMQEREKDSEDTITKLFFELLSNHNNQVNSIKYKTYKGIDVEGIEFLRNTNEYLISFIEEYKEDWENWKEKYSLFGASRLHERLHVFYLEYQSRLAILSNILNIFIYGFVLLETNKNLSKNYSTLKDLWFSNVNLHELHLLLIIKYDDIVSLNIDINSMPIEKEILGKSKERNLKLEKIINIYKELRTQPSIETEML